MFFAALVLVLIVLPRLRADEAGGGGNVDSAGEPSITAVARLLVDHPPTVVRTYHGKQQADAVPAFQAEAKEFAQYGYAPTSQSWAQGQWGCGAFLIALLLAIVLIGILIFLYLLVVKPDGTLTVVYARQAHTPTPTEPAPDIEPPAAGDLSTRLTELDAARAAGLITEDEYAAKRAAILNSL